MRRLGALLFLVGTLVMGHSTPAEANCGSEYAVPMSGNSDAPWAIEIQFNPKTVPLNVPFGASVTVCSKSERIPTRLTIDATMPAHKHGMNYQPSTVQIDSHRHEVKNLLFHMPGMWRLEITAYENDEPHRFTYDVNLQ